MARITQKAMHCILAVAAMAVLGAPARAQVLICDRELLTNSYCEEPLVNGEIPGWTEVVGNDWTARTADPPPDPTFGGQAYFSPGDAAEAELSQTHDFVAAPNGAVFRVSYRTGAETPSDVVRIVCEYRAVEDGPIIKSTDSGELTSPGQWSWYGGFFWAEPARWIRVRLLASRRSGSTTDAWFDNASFFVNCADPVSPTTWSGVKALYR